LNPALPFCYYLYTMFINLIKNQTDMLEQFYLPVTNVFLKIVF
jgi:hypothetical protein